MICALSVGSSRVAAVWTSCRTTRSSSVPRYGRRWRFRNVTSTRTSTPQFRYRHSLDFLAGFSRAFPSVLAPTVNGMSEILSAIESDDAVARDFEALPVPESYRAVVVEESDADMFAGLQTR